VARSGAANLEHVRGPCEHKDEKDECVCDLRVAQTAQLREPLIAAADDVPGGAESLPNELVRLPPEAHG
jgi:hypothetical protein